MLPIEPYKKIVVPQLVTKQQLILINTLISKLNINKDTKETMVLGFTLGRSISTKDLTQSEASDLIKHLKSLDPTEASAEKMRRAIIAMAHEMKWQLANGKADMQRINQWCIRYGGKNKDLNAYHFKELHNLVTAFKQMYLKFLGKL